MPVNDPDNMDEAYLKSLIKKRKRNEKAYAVRNYLQGRIDEFCAQNAIVQTDYPKLDLRLDSVTV